MKKLARNEPCHCGSGKKYKNCHQSLADREQEVHSSQDNNLVMVQLVNQGTSLLNQGKFEAAAGLYRQALQIDPTKAEAHSNLGYALEQLGRLDEAISCYRHAIKIKPNMAELQNNLGDALQSQNNFKEAEACFRLATKLNPDFAAGHFNLARLLQILGRHGDAAASCRKVLALQPNNAQAHSNLGFALDELGQREESLTCYRKALEIDPGLVVAQKGVCTVLGHLVPEWHVPMMNDVIRNEAYYAALKAAISPESNVFEIGTGSGLLSMMAAKLGAKTVTTCEAESIVAATAKRIIASNGLEDRIRVIPKKSTALVVGKDMQEPADIMVSEILSSELLGEHVLSSIEDARRRLLKPGARIIPSAAGIVLSLFGGKDIATNLSASMSCGFDLSEFNKIVPGRQSIARNDLPIEMLSEEIEAFHFDFEKVAFAPSESKILRIPVTAEGRCLGIIQWIRLKMFDDICFENHPSVKAPASAWTRCAYIFPDPIDLKLGQVAVIAAAHNRVFPWFSLIKIE